VTSGNSCYQESEDQLKISKDETIDSFFTKAFPNAIIAKLFSESSEIGSNWQEPEDENADTLDLRISYCESSTVPFSAFSDDSVDSTLGPVYDFQRTPAKEGMKPGDILFVTDLTSRQKNRPRLVRDLLYDDPGRPISQDILNLKIHFKQPQKWRFNIGGLGKTDEIISLKVTFLPWNYYIRLCSPFRNRLTQTTSFPTFLMRLENRTAFFKCLES
jgi:hypothetical protein